MIPEPTASIISEGQDIEESAKAVKLYKEHTTPD